MGTHSKNRPLQVQRALVTGPTLYIDGSMALYPGFDSGG
jgi:hypothetical protein